MFLPPLNVLLQALQNTYRLPRLSLVALYLFLSLNTRLLTGLFVLVIQLGLVLVFLILLFRLQFLCLSLLVLSLVPLSHLLLFSPVLSFLFRLVSHLPVLLLLFSCFRLLLFWLHRQVLFLPLRIYAHY
jgi:hypothetical protein